MITIIAKLRAKPGKESLLAEECAKLAQEVREKEKDCLMYIPHVSDKNPAEIIFVEKYLNEDAFNQHRNTPYFKASSVVFKDLLDAPSEVQKLTELV